MLFYLPYILGAGAILVVLYAVSAFVFVMNGGTEGVFKSFTYKAFVARRYLMIPERKITPFTRNVILASLLARVACAAWLAATSAGATVAIDAAHAAEIVGGITVVGGVLIYSKPALYLFAFGAAVTMLGVVAQFLSVDHVHAITSPFYDGPGLPPWFSVTVLILTFGGSILAGLAILFGTLRAFFTFFTTVPIGGVWIGTAALVSVLAVMSGFESDLREKILGSNAHIRITKESGEIANWRELKTAIDKVPGVVASTPYATSEVVIAASGNGMPVIIKGVDPKTVGAVTQLVNDLEDKDAMKRLEPIVDDAHDLTVKPRAVSGATVDPGPANEPSSSDPIDFSEPAPPAPKGSGAGSGAGSAAPTPGTTPAIGSNDAFYGSDGQRIYLGSGSIDTMPIDANFDAPTMSKRTQSLPGILVGKELVKQTHLYLGEEVRVVSPLSDPSNPDATGTPIPFNRDYRVAGIFYTGMYEYDLKYVYVSLDSFQEFLDRGDSVEGIEVRITDPDDTDEVMPRISAALAPLGKDYTVVDWKEINRSLFSALKLEKIAMFLVLGIVILVASFSIVGNLIMVVVEKGREIALLKTLGASDAGVMHLFAIQGLLIGLIGTTIGVATGLVTCYAGKHYGIPLNPDVYYIDRMPVHVDASSVFVTFLAGVMISIAATFYPALLAARVRPADGLRH